ncbi:MAG: polysaccharide biosynthesis tyrosine autokinase [Thermodesulfovibrionales bacterium]|nr:polysaccharide biosynthesis tyrosine autokinase [Thermodesulfovibrionales bacterium]
MEREDNNENRNQALESPHPYPPPAPPGQFVYQPPPQQEEEVHLRDYLNVILRRKWILITFFVAVVTTVTIGTFLKEPVYESTITIRIDKENPNILSFKDVVNLERAEEDYYQTQYKVLMSRNLAKRVVRSLKLNTHPEFASLKKAGAAVSHAGVLDKKKNIFEDGGISSDLIDTFLSRVKVSPLQKSRLVNVSFTSRDPELAAKVADTIGEAFIELNIESKFEATQQARTWLEKQLDVMKAKVEQAEESLNEYASKNEIIFLEKTDAQGKGAGSESIVTKKLSEFSTELTAATTERISREALYRQMHSGEHDANSVVMNNPLILELKKTCATLEAEYNQQLKIYKPEYPRMVQLKEQLNQVKKRIDQETKKIVTSVRKDYETAVKRETYLKSALSAQKKEALDLNQRAVQYQILKREADTNKELYNGLLQRLKETGVSVSLTASNIQVLDKAEAPRKPSKPNKTMNIMLAIVVGLFGGVGLAFFSEYLDNTIKTPEDIEKRIAVPFLGLVPCLTDNKENLPVESIAHADARGPMAEAYRSIRTFLLLSSGGKPPKVMMVTSPIRDEGKTTTVVNIAISLTKSDVKAIIIDADMRKPRLHHIFRLENTIGLSAFLSGNIEIRDGIIKTTGIENLHIIPSGPVPPNPAELLSSYKFQELIYGLYPFYNFILIDTPPVLGIADPLIVSQRTDGVILVVKSEKTPKEAAQEARRLLASVNAKILGAVLNSIDQSAFRYSNYYNYYRYYYTDEKK